METLKSRYKLDLQYFSEGEAEPGVEEIPAAEGTDVVDTSEPGVETEVAAEPEKQNNFEKAFAKRLAAEREKWQKEISEKYGDYETHKELSSYLQEINNLDALSLKERIELERLQSRAEKENVSPEVLKRIDELEKQAEEGRQLKEQQQQQQITSLFWQAAEKFTEGKDISKEDLNQYMVENGIFADPMNPEDAQRKFNLAYNAMRAEALEKQLEQAEKEGMKKLIQSKSNIATIPSKAGQGQVIQAPPKTFAEARQRAMQRMNGEG